MSSIFVNGNGVNSLCICRRWGVFLLCKTLQSCNSAMMMKVINMFSLLFINAMTHSHMYTSKTGEV